MSYLFLFFFSFEISLISLTGIPYTDRAHWISFALGFEAASLFYYVFALSWIRNYKFKLSYFHYILHFLDREKQDENQIKFIEKEHHYFDPC